MLDFDKELSTFYQLLDEIETEERRLGTCEEALPRSSVESGLNSRSSDSDGRSGGVSSPPPRVGSGSSLERGVDARKTEALIAERVSLLLSALSKQRRVVGATVAVLGILIVGISHGGSLLEPSLGLVSQSEPSTASLTISTDPGGARVFVDGELVGVSPFEEVQISSGSSALAVVKPGFARLDSLIDASEDLLLHLPLQADADEVDVVETASLTSTQVLPLADMDSLQSDSADTLVASVNDTLLYAVAPAALRLPTLPVEIVRPTVQPRSGLWGGSGRHVADTTVGEEILPSVSTVDQFSGLLKLADEHYRAGLYAEATALYEKALQLRPGNTAIVNSLRIARAAAAIDELPSTVFSPQEPGE